MQIQAFQQKDAKKVSELIHKTLQDTNSKDYPNNIIEELCSKYSPEQITKLSYKRKIFVISDEYHIIGVGGIENNIVSNVFIHPDFHGKGLGRKMMEYLENEIIKNGFQTIQLKSSITAYGFYVDLGYRKIDETNEYGVTEIIMGKKIS